MSTTKKYNFWKLIEESEIAIPKFQRDYAQGRKDIKSEEIRKEFVKNLFQSLNDANYKIQLDFVYGAIQNDCFEPLDGQQRLTTLYLLHLYVATREKKLSDEVKDLFKKFSYETRQSSTDFCQELVKGWSLNEIPSESIKDQTWYSNMWDQDSTIQGMLTMLDAIHEEYNKSQSNQLWDKLIDNQEKITFYKLNLEEFGLSDELYIKMNARGKPLTDFENLKAQLLHFFSYGAEGNKSILEDKEHEAISKKFDQSWTDFFWAYVKDLETNDKGKELDKRFKNFLDFITIVLYRIEKSEESLAKIPQNFQLYAEVYKNEKHRQFVFGENGLLDKFSVLKKEGLKDLFENQIFTDQRQYHDQKIFIQRNKTLHNLLEVVFETGKQDSGGDLLLYAILYQISETKLNNNTINNIDHLRQRLRILRNIIWNSGINAESSNHLNFAQEIMIDENIETLLQLKKWAFANDQRIEEIRKHTNEDKFTEEQQNLILQLENHPILMGTVKPFLDNSQYLTKEYVDTFYLWFENKDLKNGELNNLRIKLLCTEPTIEKSYMINITGNRYKLCRDSSEWKDSFKKKYEIYFDLLKLYKCTDNICSSITEPWLEEMHKNHTLIDGIYAIDFWYDKGIRLMKNIDYTSSFVGLYPRIFRHMYNENPVENVKYDENFTKGEMWKFVYGCFHSPILHAHIFLHYEYEEHLKYSLWFEISNWGKHKLEKLVNKLDQENIQLIYDGGEWYYIDNLESADVLTVLDIIKDIQS